MKTVFNIEFVSKRLKRPQALNTVPFALKPHSHHVTCMRTSTPAYLATRLIWWCIV